MEVNKVKWKYEEDKTSPIISAKEHVLSGHRSQKIIKLPNRAIIFCIGMGLDCVEENYETITLMDSIPGFITHSKVLKIKGNENTCFVHGGYGSPAIADTIETLHALGVNEIVLVGMCGVFSNKVEVGNIIIPNRILSEEGTSRHYYSAVEFVKVHNDFEINEIKTYFEDCSFKVIAEDTVTTDALYRETFFKENLWREKDCVGVDMEASALVSVCNYYNMKSIVLLLASDKHPKSENEKSWVWGKEDFKNIQRNFVKSCTDFF